MGNVRQYSCEGSNGKVNDDRKVDFNLWYHEFAGHPSISQNSSRCTMKVSQAADFHLQHHKANAKKNTVRTFEFVLSRLTAQL